MTDIVNAFHNHYYNSLVWEQTYWLGHHIYKCPLDLFIYQELIYKIKPDVIIECGTNLGGSALYMASICDLIHKGRIITIDINSYEYKPTHPRIAYFIGDSASNEILNKVRAHISPTDVVMVILDSEHTKQHVLNEMNQYHHLVSIGSYMIVEDTIINNPVLPAFGPGPMEAVSEFLSERDDFIIDTSQHKHHLSFNPNGYLKRIK